MIKRAKFLHKRHQGERCFLVCNGPSLNQMDLRKLRNETVIGLNKIFLGIKKFGFYPRYYVAVNPKVIEQSHQQIKELNCVKFLSQAGRAFLEEDPLTYIIQTDGQGKFSTDLTQVVHEGWTVTHVALQVAYYLGFQEVIIIGMDHRYQYDGQPNESRLMAGPDPNHFSPDYFGNGQRWDNPDLKNAETAYQPAREAFERDGRRIYDATLNGACTVFEKIPYPL